MDLVLYLSWNICHGYIYKQVGSKLSEMHYENISNEKEFSRKLIWVDNCFKYVFLWKVIFLWLVSNYCNTWECLISVLKICFLCMLMISYMIYYLDWDKHDLYICICSLARWCNLLCTHEHMIKKDPHSDI